jgi:hypothetical protein
VSERAGVEIFEKFYFIENEFQQWKFLIIIIFITQVGQSNKFAPNPSATSTSLIFFRHHGIFSPLHPHQLSQLDLDSSFIRFIITSTANISANQPFSPSQRHITLTQQQLQKLAFARRYLRW